MTGNAGEDALDIEDRLCLAIGRVARMHVSLDIALRSVYRLLTAPGLGYVLGDAIPSTERLASDCRAMLEHADVPPEVIAAGTAALGAAQKANEARNRAIHDLWLREPTDDPVTHETARWSTRRTSKPRALSKAKHPETRDLDFVGQARVDLYRACIRVQALCMALFDDLPILRDRPNFPGESRDESRRQNLAVMNDGFDLFDDGGYRVHGEDGVVE